MTINATAPAYAAILSPFVEWWIIPPPKHCSPQLQQSGSQEDPDNDGSNVSVGAIYYGEARLDVDDVELAAVGSVHCSETLRH
jgi:hypothetical protein